MAHSKSIKLGSLRVPKGVHPDAGDSGSGYGTSSGFPGSGDGSGSGGSFGFGSGSDSGVGGSAGFGSGLGIDDDDYYYDGPSGASVTATVRDNGYYLTDTTSVADVGNPSLGSSAEEINTPDSQEVIVTASASNTGYQYDVYVETDDSNYQVVVVSPPSGQSYIMTDSPASQDSTPVRFAATGDKGSQSYYDSVPAALNPKTVPILSSGNTVSVFLVQAGAGGFGHLAMSLNGSATISITSATGAAVGAGYASIGSDNDPSTGTALFGTMAISASQANQLQSIFATAEAVSAANQQSYNVITNNCAEFVTNSLTQIGEGAGFSGGVLNADPDVDFVNFMTYAAVTGELTNAGSMKP